MATDKISTESKFAMTPYVFRVAFVNGNEARQLHVVAPYAESAIDTAVRHIADAKFSSQHVTLCERLVMIAAISSSIVADARFAAAQESDRLS